MLTLASPMGTNLPLKNANCTKSFPLSRPNKGLFSFYNVLLPLLCTPTILKGRIAAKILYRPKRQVSKTSGDMQEVLLTGYSDQKRASCSALSRNPNVLPGYWFKSGRTLLAMYSRLIGPPTTRSRIMPSRSMKNVVGIPRTWYNLAT